MQESTVTSNHLLMAEEAAVAQALFPQYARSIIVRPQEETEEAHKRAMLQTVFRLQLLRIEISKLLSSYVEIPGEVSVLKTEESFLKFMALQLAETQGDPQAVLADLSGMFEVDLSEVLKLITSSTATNNDAPRSEAL